MPSSTTSPTDARKLASTSATCTRRAAGVLVTVIIVFVRRVRGRVEEQG